MDEYTNKCRQARLQLNHYTTLSKSFTHPISFCCFNRDCWTVCRCVWIIYWFNHHCL